MSTQLIVYPQNYNGIYNVSYSYYYEEYITNGQVFGGFNNTTIQDVSNLGLPTAQLAIQQEYTASGSLSTGAWYRFKTSGTRGVTTEPVMVGGNIVFPTTPSGPAPGTGVFQLVNNLVSGVSYDLKVNTNTAAGAPAATMVARVHDNSGNPLSAAVVTNGASIGLNFTATSSIQIFSLNYYSATLSTTVVSISVNPSPPVATQIFQDGQVICDLYQEEDIPLTLSVDEFKNVAEQVKSYSKDFNLPATKRNNRIFNNMFEVTRSDDGIIFNPYVKTKCVLKQDGFILFEGFLRMINIKDDKGEISYNVNLYSEVIALAETLEELTFQQLDFDELAHNYNISNIVDSWNDSGTGIAYPNPNTSGFRDAYSTVKYPNIDWNHQFYPDTLGNPVLPNLESMFRPCIQLKYLINKIFGGTEFTYTSAFFDTSDFEKLYMDFNWGANNAPILFSTSGGLSKFGSMSLTTAWQTLKLHDLAGTFSDSFGWDSATGIFTAVADGQMYTMDYYVEVDHNTFAPLGFHDLDIEVLVNGVINYTLTQPVSSSGYIWNPGVMTIGPLLAGDTVYVRAKCPDGILKLDIEHLNSPTSTFTTTSAQSTNESLLHTLRGELGQWDFLKGIMTMFNLVSMADPNEKNNIIIEPYADVFVNPGSGTDLLSRNIEHDWTEKVDVSGMELKPLSNLNKITKFQFTEDEDDYVFSVFKKSSYGHLYGSYSEDASLSAQGLPTSLEGTQEIVVESFAATVSKPLMTQYPDFIIPSIYAMTDDGTAEEFENLPRIFYNNGMKSLSSCTYDIPAQNGGVTIPTASTILQFSHLTDIPTIPSTTQDFVFKSNYLIGMGAPPVNNLYSVYWQPYFDELYNPDTRLMTLKVNLSPTDIANFKFTEKVFIKNSLFRVNKIEYKPNDLAKVEFIRLP